MLDRPQPSRVWVAIVLLLAVGVYLVGLDWGLPAFRSWSPDDVTPVGVLKTAYGRFSAFSIYPPFHYFLVSLVYAPYAVYLLVTGGLVNPTETFPYGLTDPLTALSTFMVLGRLVSVAMGVGIVYCVLLATRTLTGDNRVALLAAAGAAFNAHVVLFSHLGNVDVPAVFWLSLALVWYARVVRDWRPRDALFLGIAAALAISTKEQMYSALAGMAAIIVFFWLRERRAFRPLVFGFFAFLVAYVLANNVILGWGAYVERVLWRIEGPGLHAGGLITRFQNSQTDLLTTFLENVVVGMGWPLFIAAAVGCIIAFRRQRDLLVCLIVPAVSYYGLFIPFYRSALPRFTLPEILFLAPLAGLALSRLLDGRPGHARRVGPLTLWLTLAFSFLWGARVDVDLLRDARYPAEAYISDRIPREAAVEVYSMLMYLPRLQEMGYTVCRIPERQDLARFLTPEALALRSPDVIVLSSAYFPRFGSPISGYFEDLIGGRLGYSSTVFRGEPAWLGVPSNKRISPTIWVLERASRVGPPASESTYSCVGELYRRDAVIESAGTNGGRTPPDPARHGPRSPRAA